MIGDTPSDEATPIRSRLDEISTRWEVVGDPIQFVMRYGPAVKKYLHSLISNEHDAEDVCQDFLANSLSRGFHYATPDRGRFRHYLKAALRNSALAYFRHQKRAANQHLHLLEHLAAQSQDPAADDHWLAAWRQCVLDRAWARLHNHQRKAIDTQYYSVLRIALDHEQEDRALQAARMASVTGKDMPVATYRKQLSRARQLFAEFVIDEVSQTVHGRAAAEIRDELATLGLLEYVRASVAE